MTTRNASFTLILLLNLVVYLKAEWSKTLHILLFTKNSLISPNQRIFLDQNTALVVNKFYILKFNYFPRYVYESPFHGQEELMYYKHSFHDPDSHTFYYCPDKSYSQNKSNDSEWQHCLFRDKIFVAAATKPVSICDQPVEPLTRLKLSDKGEAIPCAQGSGFIYQAIYKKAWFTGKEKDNVQARSVEAFAFCYNFHEQVYSYYRIDAPDLLTNPILSEEQRASFDLKNYYYNKAKNDFEHFEAAYRDEYENTYVPQMVASPEFMAFALQRKPLYDYSNVKPMLKGLVKAWNDTMKLLRSRIIKKKIQAHLYFGTLGVVKILQITEEIQLKVPKTWWILMYDQNQRKAISILMPNQTEIPRESLPCESICRDVGLADLTSRSDRAVIYCCPASVVTNELGLKKVDKELNLSVLDRTQTRAKLN